MVSKPEPEYWYVELELDHADRLFTVRKIGRVKDFPYVPPFYVQTRAEDEIGAFNEAQKVLNRLGFRNNTDQF